VFLAVPLVRAETEINTFPYNIHSSGVYYLGTAYTSPSTVAQPLISIDADDVILDGQNLPIIWNSPNQIVISVHTGNNIIIRNFNISNVAAHGSGDDWQAVQIRAFMPMLSNVTIENSYFSGGNYITIVDFGTNTKITNCTIENGHTGYYTSTNPLGEKRNTILQDCNFNNMSGPVFQWGFGPNYAPNIIIENVNVTGILDPAGFAIPNNATVTKCNVFDSAMGFSFATDAGQTSILRSSNVYGSLQYAALDFRNAFGGNAIIKDCHLENFGTASTSSVLRYENSLNTANITLTNNTLESANYLSLTAGVTAEVYVHAVVHNMINCSSVGVLPTAVASLVFNDSVCGNFWANSAGTGWSQINVDVDGDGIIDLPYVIDAMHTDYLPLSVYPFGALPPVPPPTPTPTPTLTVTPTPPPSGGGGGWVYTPTSTPAPTVIDTDGGWGGFTDEDMRYSVVVVIAALLIILVLTVVAAMSGRRR